MDQSPAGVNKGPEWVGTVEDHWLASSGWVSGSVAVLQGTTWPLTAAEPPHLTITSVFPQH